MATSPLGNFSPLLNSSGPIGYTPTTQGDNYAQQGQQVAGQIGNAASSFGNWLFKPPTNQPSNSSFSSAFPIYNQLGGMQSKNIGGGFTVPSPSMNSSKPIVTSTPSGGMSIDPAYTKPVAQSLANSGTGSTPSYASLYANDVAALKNSSGSSIANTQANEQGGNNGVLPPGTNPWDTSSPNSSGNPFAKYITNSSSTPNGGNITTDGNGTPTSYTSGAGYNIDTSGNTGSSALAGNTGYGDVQGKQQTLQDYVNALALANGYSPSYIQALQQEYSTQGQAAGLQATGANIQAQLATGLGTTGLSQGAAQTLTGQEEALNTQQEQQVNLQNLSAQQALNTAQLSRTGNIAAAQAQLQYSPGSVNAQNAQSQYNALQQEYAGVNIPAFDPSQDPNAQLQNARFLIATSPAYTSQFQNTFTPAQGGTGIYSKLDPTNGQITLVGGAQAALGAADQANIAKLSDNYNTTIAPTLETIHQNYGYLMSLIQSYGLNQSSLPLGVQLQQKVDAGALNPAAMKQFNTTLQDLRSSYAQIIARGGSPSVTDEALANAAIPSELNYAQYQQFYNTVNATANNYAQPIMDKINSLYGNLGGVSNTGSVNSGVGGSSNSGATTGNTGGLF